MDQSVVKVLNIDLYSDSVKAFSRFFAISKKNADLTLLEEVLTCFSRLPYENISKIIKQYNHFNSTGAIRLPTEVMEDHTLHRLGGTCFSLTFFLQTILMQYGFQCYPVMADMRWGKNVHCALIVLYNQKYYLTDPGYLLHKPFEMDTNNPRIYFSDHSGVEILFASPTKAYEVYTFNHEKTIWRYRFWNRPVKKDIFLSYWLDSFHWNSMHGLCLTKSEKGKMIYVHKYFMRETTFEGKRNFNIKNNYHKIIQSHFGIDPERVEEALSALEANMVNEKELGLWIPKKNREKM